MFVYFIYINNSKEMKFSFKWSLLGMLNQRTFHANDTHVKGFTIIEIRIRYMVVNETITQQSSNDVDIRNCRQPYSL